MTKGQEAPDEVTPVMQRCEEEHEDSPKTKEVLKPLHRIGADLVRKKTKSHREKVKASIHESKVSLEKTTARVMSNIKDSLKKEGSKKESTETGEAEEAEKLPEHLEDRREKPKEAKDPTVETWKKLAGKTREKSKSIKENLTWEGIQNNHWTFMWSIIASWLVGPQFLIALWDHVMKIAGQSHLMSGENPAGWGFLNGVAPWFRDQVSHHMESGSMVHIATCAAFGVGPLILAALANTFRAHAGYLLGAAVLGPVLYLVGVSYWGWTLLWDDVYLVGLFSSAWYCTVWAIERKTGFFKFILMIPVAAIFSGGLTYAPDAAF